MIIPALYACLIGVEGKQAITSGPGEFNIQASAKYAALSSEDKEKLVDAVEREPVKKLTKKDVIKEGTKIFKKMNSLVREPSCN